MKNEIKELNKDKILTKIGIMSLTRNFGGLSSSLENIKSKFQKLYTNYNEDESYTYNILECIKDNLNDYNDPKIENIKIYDTMINFYPRIIQFIKEIEKENN